MPLIDVIAHSRSGAGNGLLPINPRDVWPGMRRFACGLLADASERGGSCARSAAA
jgi:hypothetical protein